jgi:outer membrane beta-barrel protein
MSSSFASFQSGLPSLRSVRWWAAAALVTISVGLGSDARAASPGLDAIEEYKRGRLAHTAVENRFFIKEKRFELAPMVGYVPNNPYARRYTAGVAVAYHFNETIAAQAQVFVSPDLGEGDVKGLVGVLLQRAFNSSSDAEVEFQQPLDKVTLGANFGAVWSPFYGKINLVGETVLNMDFYLYGGAGIVSKHNYYATFDEAGAALTPPDPVQLENLGNEVKVGPYIGIGQNYFLNRVMSFKLDFRSALWVDNTPQYDPNVESTQQRVYNNVILSGGVAFFLPNMKPRLYDF